MFKKTLSMFLVLAMLLPMSLAVFADDYGDDFVADYIEVVMDDDVKAEYDAMEGSGLPFTHVAFKKRIWGLRYYEMGLDQSIRNTHKLTANNIKSIDFGKGFKTKFFAPYEGNDNYKVTVDYKKVKHGYWFPRTHTVMVIHVSTNEIEPGTTPELVFEGLPIPEKVSLKMVPNLESPFAGGVSFKEGENGFNEEGIENYLKAITNVEVLGREYSYLDIDDLLDFVAFIKYLIENAGDVNFLESFKALLDDVSQPYSYYLLPQQIEIDKIKEYWEDAKPIFASLKEILSVISFEKLQEFFDKFDFSNLQNPENIWALMDLLGIENIEDAQVIIDLVQQAQTLFEKIKSDYNNRKKIVLGLTADGFNLPLNTTVKITAQGYSDLTFTFDGVGNIVSYDIPEEPKVGVRYNFVERDVLCDYLRLTFDNADEYDVADYVAKITKIKVNGEYYKKHSSLVFKNAYMLSKVKGDVLGYYVYADMTLDGFEDGNNEVEIIAEGYQNLKFTVEK